MNRRQFLGAAAALAMLPDDVLDQDKLTPGEGPPKREIEPAVFDRGHLM